VKTISAALITLLLAFCVVSSTFADETTRLVQTELKRQGYYAGAIDGAWGSQTAAAVRRFQLANDLRPTGELNAATLATLGVKDSTPAAAPAVPKYKALAELFSGGPYLNAPPEFQVTIVKKAKENLKLLGYYQGAIDQDPSPDLTDALKRYQKNAKFRATGRLDKTTLQALDLLTLPNAPY
jgi:peptidoglycan hydrolase-like protein with peptidoglycan-binding domain